MTKTKMETVADNIIDMFHNYSGQSKDSEKDTLDPVEFKKMIEVELPHFVKQVRDPKALENFFAKVDGNKNKHINFEEFMKLFGEFVVLSHEKFHHQEGGPHDHPHHH
ncbi:protein MRP-126 [Anolis carolinensis]|uniref:EF-hand domain-containing protein n=1 Tax=Anolis carolinensis TaxID=28377 RepID=A0A803TCP5_ANOCA|nr:PREDICTED: protein MRP-126 [Anolis carolinensis]|eukprot:XP_003229666.1 PREDICTED: protein MRP-126 [Anolis carolinensis]